MARIAYYRVSTGTQSIEAQRSALSGPFDKEFADEAVSGGVHAGARPGFREMLSYVRGGDTLHVYAIDRLGRDAIDVQQTVRLLLGKAVTLHVHGLGVIASGVGEVIVAVLAQIAQMERRTIVERTAAGRNVARATFEATGRTHNGATSLGRPPARDAAEVRAWRASTGASLSDTAAHFDISLSTVKRYLAPGTTAVSGKPLLKATLAERPIDTADDPVHLFHDTSVPCDAALSESGWNPAVPVLPKLPVVVGPHERDLHGVAAAPSIDETVVDEINAPLPLRPDEGPYLGATQGRIEIFEHPVAIDGRHIEPARIEPRSHRRSYRRLVGEDGGAGLPVRSIEDVDDQMPLPFNDPQTGVGDKGGG